ncbi:MAG: hypothetical protein ABJC13_21640 [Acidobacteriota bacterium]
MSARQTLFSVARLLALVVLLGVPASPGSAEDQKPCASPKGTYNEYSEALVTSAPGTLKLDAEKEISDELASRATADGLAGGRLDLLRRAFVALDLGQVKDEEGQLVFNFNPDALRLETFGQFSPRIIVHQPTLYGALDKKIDTFDEAVRQGRRDALKKDLGDLDDVEVQVRWTPKSQEPATDLQEVSSRLYDSVEKQQIAKPLAVAKGEILAALGLPPETLDELLITDICGNEQAKEILLDLPNRVPRDVNTELEKRLDKTLFFALADLIDGEPRLVFNGTTRWRSNAAGPDEVKLNATWQRGWISYRGAKKFAQAKFGSKDITVDSVGEYFKENGRLEGALPLFSLSADYSQMSSFHVAIPGVADEFRQDSAHKFSGKANAGRYFGGGRDRRLELAASYDDVTDDPTLNDRWLFTLSWVEQLSPKLAQAVGGSEFVATLIYANKAEFRGDVDKDFGLRAGLKWSLGKKEDLQAAK